MGYEIKVKREYFRKKAGTKTVWELVETKHQIFTPEQHRNFVEAGSFFRGLGGGEHHEKSYTSRGYKTTRVISTRPDREEKRVTYFDFDGEAA